MKTKFYCYEPQVKPLSSAQGGGFVVTLQVPENQWDSLKELNHPANKQLEFVVILKGKKIK